MFTPKEIASNYVGTCRSKVAQPPASQLILGILAGVFIALAAVGANTIVSVIENPGAARVISALLFPAGLAMVIIAGSELFTGNNLMVIGLLERQISLGQLLRNWALVYIGNFIGSVLIAFLVSASHQLGLFSAAIARTTIDTAVAKVSLSFGDAFLRGMLCNFLVCIAVWMSFSAKTPVNKIAAFFFPIMLFVLSGFEHSVANMYYGPAGLFALGNPAYAAAATADVSVLSWGSFFLNNLLPVTLGNIVGGSGLAGLTFWFLYLRKSK